MKKRLLLLTMILTILTLSTGYAENYEFAKFPFERELPVGSVMMEAEPIGLNPEIGFFSLISIDSETKNKLYNLFVESTTNHEKKIDISSFEIPAEQAYWNEVTSIYFRALLENPTVMAYPKIPAPEITDTNCFKSIEPQYIFETKDEDDTARTLVESSIKHYTDLVKDIPDTLGKMLVVHDELAKNIVYAQAELDEFNEYERNKETPPDELWYIYTGYGLFKNNRAVCQGYAIALAEIYERLGVEAVFCESDSLNHIWIAVKYNDNWYHVDPTWNDSTINSSEGITKGAFHNYFMISTETENARRKQDWEAQKEQEGWTEYLCDHEYWSDENVSCTDKNLESGQIYTGDYIYNSVNYGSWHGTTTYSGGRYCVNIDMLPEADDGGTVSYYIGARVPLYSNTIKSYGAIASDIYSVQVNNNGTMIEASAVYYFINENKGNSMMFFAEYNGGLLNRVGTRSGDDIATGRFIGLPFSKDYDKVFWWNLSAMSPMCEAREVK